MLAVYQAKTPTSWNTVICFYRPQPRNPFRTLHSLTQNVGRRLASPFHSWASTRQLKSKLSNYIIMETHAGTISAIHANLVVVPTTFSDALPKCNSVVWQRKVLVFEVCVSAAKTRTCAGTFFYYFRPFLFVPSKPYRQTFLRQF